MSTLDESALTDGINGLIASAKGLLGTPIAAAVGGALVGSAVTGAVAAGLSSSKKSSGSRSRKRKRITHTKRGWKQDRARRSKQKWEVAYQKRKRKAHSNGARRRGVHYTKNGQPYVLLKSGKAKFIKGKRRRG